MNLQRLALGTTSLFLGLTLVTAPAQAQLEAELVASGFSAPLWLGSPPGDSSRMFICEQSTGRVKIIKDGVVLPTPFLDIGSISLGGGERGLLGMAFHPDYATNRTFYVSYSNNSGHSMVRSYEASASNPDVADPASFTDIFGPVSQPYSNHNGGCIRFSPVDGKLYLGLGDGGSGNDPGNRAQNGQQLLGKILRLNDDGSIPANNPFVGNGSVRDEIWAIGVRNPWRFSFDRQTGDLWTGDVGQNSREEINFEAAGDGGNNYGWRCMEGFNCTGLSGCTCNSSALTLPIHDYSHGSGCSVTGGYRYRGTMMPSMTGRYFFGDYCSGRVWSFAFNGSSSSNLVDHTSDLAIPGGESITSFGEDDNGDLYIVDASGGQIWRLQEECAGITTTFCVTSPNSVGTGTQIASNGNTSVAANDFELQSFGSPTAQFALYYYGPNEIQVPFGDGFRCVGGSTFRLNPPQQTDVFGDFVRVVDMNSPPASSGPGMISAGDTWKFQLWYRDPTGGASGFNLSDALSADFCP
ncbi:MAG TPA: PQQ-dependent sugar dehydrogenase [Planctomycetota bacterium]|nr:PQQ-dependent sugar dehydrogenase [Planctomycetota bacterium]